MYLSQSGSRIMRWNITQEGESPRPEAEISLARCNHRVEKMVDSAPGVRAPSRRPNAEQGSCRGAAHAHRVIVTDGGVLLLYPSTPEMETTPSGDSRGGSPVS